MQGKCIHWSYMSESLLTDYADRLILAIEDFQQRYRRYQLKVVCEQSTNEAKLSSPSAIVPQTQAPINNHY
jgi:hypothetical protein